MPRFCVRSTCTSCSTPFSTSATRDSIGVILIRISSLMALSLVRRSGKPGYAYLQHSPATRNLLTVNRQRLPARNGKFFEQLGGFAEGQAHYRRITALQLADEHRRQPLNRVTASLVLGLAAGPVGGDFLGAQRAKTHLAADHPHGHPRRACPEYAHPAPRPYRHRVPRHPVADSTQPGRPALSPGPDALHRRLAAHLAMDFHQWGRLG